MCARYAKYANSEQDIKVKAPDVWHLEPVKTIEQSGRSISMR